jgi:hypothetical protein
MTTAERQTLEAALMILSSQVAMQRDNSLHSYPTQQDARDAEEWVVRCGGDQSVIDGLRQS